MSKKAHNKTMKRKTKQELKPKLRFPEFRDEPEWNMKRLGEQGEFLSSLTGKSGKDFGTGTARFITYMNVFQNTFTDATDLRAVDVRDGESQNAVAKGDVFLTVSSETPEDVGMSSVLTEEIENCYLNSFCTLFRFHRNTKPHPIFVGYLLRQSVARKHLSRRAQGSTRFNLSKGIFKDLPLLLPSPDEQQRIADCLTSLDELIAAHGRKLDALKAHKNGLMQNLFPRQGETQPRLRFPEFREAPEWTKTTLEEVAEIKLGKMLDQKKHTTGHLLPYLNNISLRWNDVDTSNLPQMYFRDEELNRFGLKAGDVVVCEGGEPGRSAVWDGRLPDLKFQKAIHRVRFNVPFEPRLLVLYLEAIAGTSKFEMLFTGGGIKHLTRETFARLKIPLVSLAEQKKIAACLSTLEDQISAQAEFVGTLKNHKKGLMQQLFPSPEDSK